MSLKDKIDLTDQEQPCITMNLLNPLDKDERIELIKKGYDIIDIGDNQYMVSGKYGQKEEELKEDLMDIDGCLSFTPVDKAVMQG